MFSIKNYSLLLQLKLKWLTITVRHQSWRQQTQFKYQGKEINYSSSGFNGCRVIWIFSGILDLNSHYLISIISLLSQLWVLNLYFCFTRTILFQKYFCNLYQTLKTWVRSFVYRPLLHSDWINTTWVCWMPHLNLKMYDQIIINIAIDNCWNLQNNLIEVTTFFYNLTHF